MLKNGPRPPRVTLPVWLALASLIPAQNAPEQPPEPEAAPPAGEESTAEAAKLSEPTPTPEEPKLPVPEIPGPPDSPKKEIPAPDMTGKSGNDEPPLPVPEAPPAGSETPLIIPGAPPAPEPSITPTGETPLMPESPGTGNELLLPGSEGGLPTSETLLLPDEAPLPEPPSADELFADPSSAESSGPGAPESPFGADQGSFGFEEEEHEGLSFFLESAMSYSSNLELREFDEESTFFTTLSPGFNYRSALSGRAINTITADYLADFNFYFDDQIDDTIDHDLKAVYTHRGSRALVELSAGFNRETQSSRFTDTLTENSNFSAQFDFTYRLSSQTSLYANAEYSTRSNDISSRGDSDLLSISLSALWDYTSKIDLGPSLRYTNNSSGATGDAEATSLGLEARYTPSSWLKWTLNAGLEAATYNDQDTEYSPAGSLRATFKPSSIWQFTGDLRYEAIPISQLNSETFGGAFLGGGFTDLNGGAAGGGQQVNGSIGVVYQPSELWRISSTLSHRTAPSFLNANESLVDTTLNFRVLRRIGDAALAAHYSYSTTEFESVGGGGREDQNYNQFGLDYNHPDLFKDLSFRASLGYAVSSGGRDYDQTSASVSFGYRF